MRRKFYLIGFPLIALAGTMVFGGTALAGDPRLSTPVEADLTGAEVDPPPGDPDGTGHINMLLYPSKNKICYRITVNDIEPATAAHLHVGGSGEVGQSVLGLRSPRETARECRRGLSTKFIRKIKQNTSNYYVDVHNNDVDGGAVRGQLTRSP